MTRRLAALIACALCAAWVTTSCGHAPKQAAFAARGPTSTVTVRDPVGPDPRIGAVFLGDRSLHACSGAVLDSPGGDLILTAAHCMADGVDAYFVPGFANQADPSEFWRVDATYLDARWIEARDPMADFAIARVEGKGGETVQARVGGLTLGRAAADGAELTVGGYAGGVGGEQVGCRARETTERGFPTLPCAGLVDGTSGAPWLAGSVITGLVGGLDGGGCEEDVSYSPPFDDAIQRLLRRAEAGGPGDAAPADYLGDC